MTDPQDVSDFSFMLILYQAWPKKLKEQPKMATRNAPKVWLVWEKCCGCKTKKFMQDVYRAHDES